MPTYAYHCLVCKHTLEAFQKITDAPLLQCPKCGKQALARGPGGGIGLSFKGSGFYKTDYASDRKPPESPSSDAKPTGCCPCGKPKGNCESV